MSLETMTTGMLKLLIRGRRPGSIANRACATGLAMIVCAPFANWSAKTLSSKPVTLIAFALAMIGVLWLETRLLRGRASRPGKKVRELEGIR